MTELDTSGPPPVAAPTFQLSTLDHVKQKLAFCPRAQTLLGYRAKTSALTIIALSCKTWSCPICRRLKINQLARITQDAKPNRLLTLTVDPKLYPNPRSAFDATRRQIPELIRVLRKKFGDIEYLRVTELTQKGWPHYHLLIRSAYIPQVVVKDHWSTLTEATIVDLRQVKETLDTYRYLVKYLSKLKHIDWTDRHVSMSRHFRLQEQNDDFVPDKLENVHVVHKHPYNYIIEHYVDRRFAILHPANRLELLPDAPFVSQQQPLDF